MTKSYQWIKSHQKELQKKYPEKIVLVCECKVVKVFDLSVRIRKIFKEADKLCKGKDWSWAYISPAEESYILIADG